MSAITPFQSLEQPQQSEIGRLPSQRWKLLQPQDELFKNLAKLVLAQVVFAGTVALLSEAWNGSVQSDWKFSIETYDALSQLWTTSFLAGLFTSFSAIFTWAYFVKSNQETFAIEITPETRIAIKDQIERTLRERSNV